MQIVKQKRSQTAGMPLVSPGKAVKVITVTGAKGGVGKTAVAANLAVGLARLGRRVMLMDADLGMANLDVVLGLKPSKTLAQVLAGSCSLEDIILSGPSGVSFVPAASGELRLAQLDERQVAGLIAAFDELAEAPEVLVLDTAAGLSSSVLRFAQAAHEVLIVICDEPASITDAYALIKLLSEDYGVRRFRIVTNMVRRADEGADLFAKICRMTESTPNVSLDHAASIPADECLQQAVQRQAPVIDAFPEASASLEFVKLADRADKWKVQTEGRGGMEFFLRRCFGFDGSDAGAVARHSQDNDIAALNADDLVARHAPLVRRIANHLKARLPENVETDDLLQAGLMALLEAARNFEEKKGACFTTYAGIRVRGAMLDEVRAMNWTPRSVHRKQRKITKVMHGIEQSAGRAATAAEVAEGLGVSMDDYQRMIADSVGARLISLDQLIDAESQSTRFTGSERDPADSAEQSAFQAAVAEVIENLPEREALVMALYYTEELNLKEIGKVLEVSESRVCQIHGQALVRVRARLNEWCKPNIQV